MSWAETFLHFTNVVLELSHEKIRVFTSADHYKNRPLHKPGKFRGSKVRLEQGP